MTCREFTDFIMDYLSGELAAAARADFETHLSICTNCQRYLASYQETVRLGRRAFENDDASLPPQIPADLVAAILAARSRRET